MPLPTDGIVNYSYQAAGGILTIRFHTGNVFQYKGVNLAVYDVFNASKDKNVFYERSIKGKYSEQQVFEYVKKVKVGDSSVFQPTELKFADTSTVTWSKNADGEIEASASAVAGGGSATPTSAQFSALSARVESNSAQMTSADDAISAAVASAINRVSALSVVVSNAVSAIVANSTQMTSADNALSAAIGVVSAAQAATSARVTANSAQMTSADDAISAAVASAVNRISALSVVVSNAVSAIVENSAALTSALNRISALSVVVSNNTSAIAANSAQMTSADNANSAAVASAINRISALSVVVSNAVSAIVANSATMTAADNALSGAIDLKNDIIKINYEGSTAATNPVTLNFSGAGVVVSAVGTDVEIVIPSANRVINIENEGSTTLSNPAILNFVGAGVSVSVSGTRIDILIAGGAGGASVTSADFVSLRSLVQANSAQMTSADNAISAANAATSARVTANSAQMTSADNAISAAAAAVSAAVTSVNAAVTSINQVVSALASTVSAGGGVWHVVADAQGISATALTDISGMSITFATNGVYEIRSHILYSVSAAACNVRFGVSSPGAVQFRLQAMYNRTDGTGFFNSALGGAAFLNFKGAGSSVLLSTASTVSIAGTLGVIIDGLAVSTTAGSFKLMAATSVATSPITIIPGSFIRAYKIG